MCLQRVVIASSRAAPSSGGSKQHRIVMPRGRHRIACAQMTSTADFQHNLQTITELCKRAKTEACEALFLPEAFARIGATDASYAEPLDGPIVRACCALAKEYGLWMSLGGYAERDGDGTSGKRFNSHVMIDPRSGEISGDVYRKIHLFDTDAAVGVDGGGMRESDYTRAGTTLASYDTTFGKVGASICYDLRFPDVYQALRFEHKADVICVPSAFTKSTGQAHWEVLLRARAIETQCYVVAAAQAGKHGETRESYGHAMVIDPWGRIVAKMDDPSNEVGIAVADIDLASVDEIRKKMPLAQHRRRVRAEF
jgi:predicted amidohydrolase